MDGYDLWIWSVFLGLLLLVVSRYYLPVCMCFVLRSAYNSLGFAPNEVEQKKSRDLHIEK